LLTVGSYWPHASTLFDYVRRAMPPTAPKSLSNTEVYQVTAFVLHLHGVIAEDFVLDKNTLPAVQMPNREGFTDVSAN
jgi:cytochrome c